MQQPIALISSSFRQKGQIVSVETASCDVNTFLDADERCEIKFTRLIPFHYMFCCFYRAAVFLKRLAVLYVFKSYKQIWHVKGCRMARAYCGIVEKVRVKAGGLLACRVT